MLRMTGNFPSVLGDVNEELTQWKGHPSVFFFKSVTDIFNLSYWEVLCYRCADDQ